MKDYKKNMRLALVCFLLVVVLNFFLPRLLPGNPVAYLTGFSEQDMTPAQVAFYEEALHLNKPLAAQFGFYLRSLLDGTLGYSYKKDAAVSALIGEKIGYTLQITVPAVLLSAGIGLLWGLRCGYKKDGPADRFSTTVLIILNAVPAFLIGLGLMSVFCFQNRLLPYTGLNSPGAVRGTAGYVWDRALHLLQPFLTMLGMSVSLCVGGSVVIEKIFSIGGMGSLLTEAVYTLDYPLMQGILFVTTCIMVLSILLTDFLCLLLDPKRRLEGGA